MTIAPEFDATEPGSMQFESEMRFRTMADHAPVLLWMAGTDGLCDYFNLGWLAFTGRTLKQEVGNGWAEGVHPEDFQRCMSTYLEAFVARRSFSMEYRMRRHDGEFRWVFDQGAPRFGPDGNFAGYIGSCVDVTEQRLARDALAISTRELEARVRERTAIALEREVLLREVHHRVKNDLQLICSLLNMQARRLTDPKSVAALEDSQARVQTIALIHEYMYQSESLAALPFSQNIRSLSASVLRVAGTPAGQVRLDVQVEDEVTLPVDRAIPCGLILTELLTNALKHAFPDGRNGTLRVVLRKQDDSRVALFVEDDGVGMPTPPSSNGRGDGKGSLGYRLIRAFAEQLGAQLQISGESGTRVGIVFAVTE